MSDFKLFPGVNLADSLSRVTSMSFENAMHELNRIDRPSVSDGLGNFDARAFNDVARSHFASNLGVCNEISRITGSSFENTMSKINMLKVGKL